MSTVRNIIVPVSGGKDSQAVLKLCLSLGHTPICVHQNTGFDHPDTYAHILKMEEFYGVSVQHTHSPHGGMFGFLEKAKYFPNSAARGCTQRLKQEPFAKWLSSNNYNKDNSEIWFGMRSDESKVRNEKYGELSTEDLFTLGDVASFYASGARKSLGEIPCRLPIVTWDTEKVFSYLAGDPLNPLYARGHHRVGCYPCLLARKAEWQAAAKDPTGREHLIRLINLEDQWKEEGNPRKFIKVHRKWNVRDFLTDHDVEDLSPEECGWCSI